MNRGEKIAFAIGTIIALIAIVIGVVAVSLQSKYPEVALDLLEVSLWGFALCLVFLTVFVMCFIIRNR